MQSNENGIIKEWLHCMTSESKGQFLVNVWFSMMSGHGTNPIFFNKKIKIGCPEHLLNPRPMSDYISFLPCPNCK